MDSCIGTQTAVESHLECSVTCGYSDVTIGLYQGFQTTGRTRRGRCWSFGDASSLYEGHIYFEQNMGSIYDIYLGRHCALFKHFAYYSIPVLAPNYKQHILTPANVRKICYSLD
jgi:hypothetical protein